MSATPPAHHVEDGTFRNSPGSPTRDFSFGTVVSFLWGRIIGGQEHKPGPEIVMARAEARHGLNVAGNPSITWLGHASFLIRLDGKTVLTDPYLGDNAGPLGLGPKRFLPPPLAVEELPPIDILVLSHNHYDHLESYS